MRGATGIHGFSVNGDFVSIHAPHARGDISQLVVIPVMYVSIHAPHARGDTMIVFGLFVQSSFNPRPSCEGRHSTCLSVSM